MQENVNYNSTKERKIPIFEKNVIKIIKIQ